MTVEQKVLDTFAQAGYTWNEATPTTAEVREHIDRMKRSLEVGEQIISGRLIVIRSDTDRYHIFVMIKEEGQT